MVNSGPTWCKKKKKQNTIFVVISVIRAFQETCAFRKKMTPLMGFVSYKLKLKK